MKMKKFFSGILAAVMSIAVIAMPLSTATAAETDPNADKCIITINHAASTGTYTAYPIFVGDVELEEGTGRKLISSPTFHKNLDTTLSGSSPIDIVARVYSGTPPTSTNGYSLWQYLKNSSWKVKQGKDDTTGKTFLELIKAYDPNTSFSSFSITADDAVSSQAEALANILNLTSTDSAVSTILNGTKTSAFYSAFAEAARMLMVDKITSGEKGTLNGVSDSVTCAEGSTSVTIEVDEPGYYLVEYTPAGDSTDYEKTPRAVRRSLVLVGKGTALSATINSKDTQNIASVDVTFNETMLVQGDDNTFRYGEKTEGTWAKNVSAGNGDYVNCRVVVTFPGNLAAYDQYYLAVPIMYGYSGTGTNDFDNNKSIKRQTGENNTENVKVYFLDDTDNKMEVATNNVDVKDAAGYTYANDQKDPTGGTTKDRFVAKETFVFNDVKKLGGSISSNTKLVIEFPVKFERFPNGMTTFNATSIGADQLGFNGSINSATAFTGDDILLKNYITARAVYSNNPNLKALKDGEEAYDKTSKPDGVKLYLDTSKDPGALQNPVGVAKESSANIVTYRLRVHATTEDIKDKSYGGVEGVYFAIKNEKGQYAKVQKIGASSSNAVRSYDEVAGENFYTDAGTLGNNGVGYTNLYTITEWVDVDKDSVYKKDNGSVTLNNDHVMQTNNTQTSYDIQKATNNTGRFEIIGLAPGTYTVVALEEAIKAREDITTSGEYKEYSISKEGGKPKTEYRFSFAPTLSTTCTKLLYNTHYAPKNFDLSKLQTYSGSANKFNTDGTYDPEKPDIHSINTTGLITNYNMKWYDKDGNEITTEANKPEWWLGQREDVALMSMRVIYIKKGLTLPVTGGIGTFIFFAVGGAMVVLSTVAIVTKLRIKREQL